MKTGEWESAGQTEDTTNAPGVLPELTNSMTADSKSLAIIIAGPAGTGKTTVGEFVAEKLNASFVEGDSVHPPAVCV